MSEKSTATNTESQVSAIQNQADVAEATTSVVESSGGGSACLDPRPQIELSKPGRLVSDVATELGQVLANCGIYNHAGGPAVYDADQKRLIEIKSAKFRTWIEKSVIPIKESSEGMARATMSSGEAGAILVSPQFVGQLRVVERVNTVRLPVVRTTGEVEVLPEGWDCESRIFTASESQEYVLDMPLEVALEVLASLFGEFPFADEERSKAIAIAAMLSLFGVDLMPRQTVVPVFLYRGNMPGLGKGLLVQIAIIPILGYAPTGIRPGETEMQKQLLAVAKAGGAVVFLDNVTGRLASPSLESFVTTSTVAGRVVGTSTFIACKKSAVVFITGNNLSMNADMTRRTLAVELMLAGQPDERVIENHIDERRLLEMRPQILAALYALVREWAAAGKPEPSSINPNFAAWSKTIGGIVEHAGLGCVTEPQKVVIDQNDADMLTLAQRLFDEHRTEAIRFADLIDLARRNGLLAGMIKAEEGLSRNENTVVGRFLTAQNERVFINGLRFVIIGKGHARRYGVQRIQQFEDQAA